MACKSLKTCPFFNDQLATTPHMVDHLKQKYCMDKSEECARFQVSSRFGADNVPSTLFPGDNARAQQMLA